jgi:hypothetical protein
MNFRSNVIPIILIGLGILGYGAPSDAAPVSIPLFIGFDLWGYTDNENTIPRFDCEGGGLHSFAFKNSGVQNMGIMGKEHCSLSTVGAIHRDFSLQSVAPAGNQQENIKYKVNTVTGSIEGNSVPLQTAQFFNVGSSAYVMNYGVSHAAPPLTDQSYIYTGHRNTTWIGDLSKQYPDLQVRDLVLPGAHDAGMYQMDVFDTAVALAKMCGSSTNLALICGSGGIVGAQLLENLSLTQKDTALSQLQFGTRFFDFRPAYAKGSSFESAKHLHNFIPGVRFDEFLKEVNTFLKENPGEIAIVQISQSGIDREQFQPLSNAEVKKFLENNVKDVGYVDTDSIATYKEKKITEIVKLNKRLIVIFHPDNVNDSYTDKDYTASLDDPGTVINALSATVFCCKSKEAYQYTVLQLQDTGSGALANLGTVINAGAWAIDLAASGTGNLLQATKPVFDNATYQWLIKPATLNALGQLNSPVILLNDFVDTALASHAIGLTKNRYQQRTLAANRPINDGRLITGQSVIPPFLVGVRSRVC